MKGNKKDYKSYKNWCIEVEREDFLDLWDYDANNCGPDEIGFSSHKKYYQKCPKGIHDSELRALPRSAKSKPRCIKCNSVGEYIMTTYDQSFLKSVWSTKNEINPFELSKCSNDMKIWWKCENKMHDDYQRSADHSYKYGYRCPHCSKSISFRKDEDFLGKTFGKLTVRAVDNRLSIMKHEIMLICDCSCGAKGVSVRGQQLKSGSSVTCGNRSVHRMGKNNSNYKGGKTERAEKIRKSQEYNNWQRKVYEKDYYTCQACMTKKVGDNIKLHAHHIISLSSLLDCNSENLFDVDNGITLCAACHYSTYKGSLHNIYGTNDVSPAELETYINQKRESINYEKEFLVREYMAGAYAESLRNANPKISGSRDITITEKCRVHGISRQTYNSRKRLGMSEIDALTTPVRKKSRACEDHLGMSFPSISEMCRKWGIPRYVFEERQKSKWTLKDSLTVPVKKADNNTCDHLGNQFPSVKKKCEYYGVNSSTYHLRKQNGWTEQEALSGVRQKEGKIIDHLNNRFPSESKMCEYYGISYSTYAKRKAKGLSLKACLNNKCKNNKSSL